MSRPWAPATNQKISTHSRLNIIIIKYELRSLCKHTVYGEVIDVFFVKVVFIQVVVVWRLEEIADGLCHCGCHSGCCCGKCG